MQEEYQCCSTSTRLRRPINSSRRWGAVRSATTCRSRPGQHVPGAVHRAPVEMARPVIARCFIVRTNSHRGGAVRYDGDRVGTAAQPALLRTRVLGLIWQLTIIYVLDKAYEATRGIIPHQADVALRHGLAVVGIEKSWHIFDEWWVQAVVFRHAQLHFGPLTIDRGAIISLVNHFYLYSHYVGPPTYLLWICRSRKYFFRLVPALS